MQMRFSENLIINSMLNILRIYWYAYVAIVNNYDRLIRSFE